MANRYIDWHAEKFGFRNVKFYKGFIEDLKSAGIEDNSIDIVISNCVVNLCPNKAKVFEEISRVLKPGGEIYFSDLYSDKEIPQYLKEDKTLWGEGLSGALYFNYFLNLVKELGFSQVRRISSWEIDLSDNLKLQD